jgi:hypothetical protein
MAMSSVSTAVSSHSLFNARVPPLRRQSSLRLVDRHVGFSGSGVAPADHRGFLPGRTKLAALAPAVAIAPANGVKRRAVSWPGMAAEVVQATSSERIAFRAHTSDHMLVLCERGARRDGETSIRACLPRHCAISRGNSLLCRPVTGIAIGTSPTLPHAWRSSISTPRRCRFLQVAARRNSPSPLAFSSRMPRSSPRRRRSWR